MTNGTNDYWIALSRRLPRSQWVRIVIGLLLIVGGVFGFLPVLGFWMIPLGVMVLSVDLPLIRRWRRKMAVWWSRRRSSGLNGKQAGGKAGEQ